MISLRRLILELWAMFMLACIVGFMGPFGTYDQHNLPGRVSEWWRLLMGAWMLVRPIILLLRALSHLTALPTVPLVFWGVVLSSAPLAALWRNVGQDEFRALDGYIGVLPFSLLCALSVLGVAQWTESTEIRLRMRRSAQVPPPVITDLPGADTSHEEIVAANHSSGDTPDVYPALLRRLPPGFRGPISALQSEDHYVRVHGKDESSLLLIRLRDAIAEMDDVAGEQVHRSWWVARESIAGIEPAGRSWILHLTSGETVPVARESVGRLQRTGFLPKDLSTREKWKR